MAINPYYDEDLHADCKLFLRTALKLYFEFAARNPTEMPVHTVYTAGEIMQAIEDDSLSLRDLAALYYYITNELDADQALLNFVKLPLLFISQETLDSEDDE